jgi:cell division protein FtsB
MALVGVVVTLLAAALAIGFVFGSASKSAVQQVSTDVKRITDDLTAAERQINALKAQCDTLRDGLKWFQERSDAIEWAARAKGEAELGEQARREATKPTQAQSDEQRRKRIAKMVVGSLSNDEQKSFAEILDQVPKWLDPNSDLPDPDTFYYYAGGKCQALIDSAVLTRFRSIEPQVASWLEQEFGSFAVYQVAVARGDAWLSSAQAWHAISKNEDLLDGVRQLERTIGLLPALAEFYAMRAAKNPQLVDRLALMLADAEANLPRGN